MKLNHLMALPPETESETVTTGFQHLDHLTGGLRTGQLCSIAARPGEGKTAFAVSLLRNIGVIQKVPTAYLSLESNKSEIMRRLKASLTGSWETVPYKETTLPADVMEEMEKIGFHLEKERDIEQEAVQMMREAPVWIEQEVFASMDEMIISMEEMHRENHVQVFFVDDLHLMLAASKRLEQLQAIFKLWQAARRLKVAVALTVNATRAVETRCGGFRPRLIDLKECFELYSSVVMFIYRPENYYLDTFEDNIPSEDMADIMVKKSSFGRIDDVRMRFDNHAGFKEALFEKDDENYMSEPSDTELAVSQPLFTLSNFTV